MRNIALTLSYDGTNYHGWQIQENLTTVQGTLQDAARKITKEEVSLIGCGRTDTGVHARYYIASFKTDCTIPIDRVPAAFNSLLPRDIVVRDAKEAADTFHPVHSCLKKEYTYEVYNTEYRNPFLNNYAHYHMGELPIDKLKAAASHFIGEHDFSSMRSLGTPVKSTIRTVYDFQVVKTDVGANFVITANGFLYNMARTMAGTLLSIAKGALNPDDIPEILRTGARHRASITAPAEGLYMTNVIY